MCVRLERMDELHQSHLNGIIILNVFALDDLNAENEHEAIRMFVCVVG